MAFNFPDTTDLESGHTVSNAERGIYYSWHADRGKWVITGSTLQSQGGKESHPYISVTQFKVLERNSNTRFDYDPLFTTNPIGTTSWEYQINLDATNDPGNWVEVSSLEQSVLDAIGWYGSMSETHLRLNVVDPHQNTVYSNAQMRFVITCELNGVVNTVETCALMAWENGDCGYTEEDPLYEEGGSAGGGGNSGGATTTAELLLANPTRLGGARTLPPVPDGLTTQEDYNRWLYDTLEKIDLWVGDDPPADPLVGQLWFCTAPDDLTLYVYDGAVWVPAAPPVSLDGIESSIASIDEELMTINRNVAINKMEVDERLFDAAFKPEDNTFTGSNSFEQPVVVAPGTHGNEAITYEQLANLAGEIDEIKVEKEKGEWIAEIPSTGSEGGREVLVNAEGFPEQQGGANMMRLTESGGDEGYGQLRILIDPNNQDDENKALQRWLKDAAAECKADPDAFKDKYSFFCPEAEEKGFAVRDQPIHSIVDPSLTTFNVIFYGKPNTAAKEEDIIGVEFFQEGAEGHRPASGKFFMEAYQDKSAQEKVCQDEYTECLTGDPAADSRCLRDLDACMDNAEDGFKPVSDFGEATAIIFHKTDGKTPPVTHSFDEVRIGDSISITDKSTGHFIVAEIDVIQQVGEHIRFTIDTVSHSGGIIDGNKCSVEFYDFSLTPGGPELDNYVKKAGDNMTGTLESTSPIWIRPGDHGAKGANNMLVVNQQDATGGSIARFQKNAKDILKIEYDKTISACENKITKVAEPQADTDAANKIYVDNKVKKGGSTVTGTIPANLVLWEYVEGGKDVVMELNSNKFTIERDGESLSIYVSAWANGRFYAAGTVNNYSHEIGHTYVTINEYDSSCVLGAKATKLWLQQRKDNDNKTVYYHIVDCSYCKSGLKDHALVAGRRYALNLPSPFPVFSYAKEYFLNTTETAQSIEDSVNEVAPEAIDVGGIHE
jgi:hypothetical protein